MTEVKLSDLNTNYLYILSASLVPGANLFSKLIAAVTKSITKNDSSVQDKTLPIVTHSALISYDAEVKTWLRHEISNNGAVTSTLAETDIAKTALYVTAIGEITSNEKQYLKDSFNRDPSKTSLITALLHYPFLKAFASVELITPKLPIIGEVLVYLLDVLRDFWYFILHSILKIDDLPEFCTEKVLDIINELNFSREEKGLDIIKLPKPLLEKLRQQHYKNYEIYPQDIIETCPIALVVI